MTTIDVALYPQATQMWEQLGLTKIVEHVQMNSLSYTPVRDIDILFLDSEPHLRYPEFVRFFDKVVPGGIILIHDLHPHLSYNESNKHWPYGDFRPLIGPYIKDHRVQTMSFPTPRGFTMFQKESPTFSFTKHIRGQI